MDISRRCATIALAFQSATHDRCFAAATNNAPLFIFIPIVDATNSDVIVTCMLWDDDDNDDHVHDLNGQVGCVNIDNIERANSKKYGAIQVWNGHSPSIANSESTAL